MTTKSETTKQIEAILGQKVGDDVAQLIPFVQKVASSNKSPGETTQKPIFF